MRRWDEVERLEPYYGVDSTMRTIVWMAKGSPGEYVRHDYANEIITELERQKRELVEALKLADKMLAIFVNNGCWDEELSIVQAAIKNAEGESDGE